jgi:hypothetical protein
MRMLLSVAACVREEKKETKQKRESTNKKENDKKLKRIL